MLGALLDTGIAGISTHHVFLAVQQLVDLGNVRHVGCSAHHAMHQPRLVIHTNVRLQSGKAGVLPLLPPIRTVLESHTPIRLKPSSSLSETGLPDDALFGAQGKMSMPGRAGSLHCIF
jgi:hypothetical protein